MNPYRISALASVVAVFGVTACTDINMPSNNPNQRTQEGAGIGALTGAILGAARADSKQERRENILKGAIVGGIAGGVIGNQLDRQAADLQASIGDDRIQIINTGEVLIVRMPQDILFAVDSATVRSALQSDLAALAGNLQRYPGSTVEVTGHTDSDGDAGYNLSLSKRRADAVASVLRANGVSGSRLRTIGAGETQPIDTNLTSAGKARNRRVEIVIRPNG